MFAILMRAMGMVPAGDHDLFPRYIKRCHDGVFFYFHPATKSFIQSDVPHDQEPERIAGWHLAEVLDEPDQFEDLYEFSKEEVTPTGLSCLEYQLAQARLAESVREFGPEVLSSELAG